MLAGGLQAAEFEVASVKQATVANLATPPPAKCVGGPGTADPGRLTCTNVPLIMLLMPAYGKEFYEVTGPQWMLLMSQGYDVSAVIPPGTTKDEYKLMLQDLLRKRFALGAHTEMKDWAGYSLEVAKGGAKIKPSAPGTTPVYRIAPVEGHVHVILQAQPLDKLAANVLHPQLRAPISNESRLDGLFDFTLDYTPTLNVAEAGGTEQAPDLFTALRTQLGLTLRQQKTKIEVLLVDHVEKIPTEN